jgi:site-specific recombinase XerD
VKRPIHNPNRTRSATRPIPQHLREPLSAMVWDLCEFGYCFKPSQSLDRFFDEYGASNSIARCICARRDALALQWIRCSGARFCEFSRIRHIDVVGNSVALVAAKGSNDRTIEFESSKLIVATSKWLRDVSKLAVQYSWAKSINQSPYLLSNLNGNPLNNNRFNDFAGVIGRMFEIRLSAHSLRDTAGHEIYRRTRDIRAVQKFMGHKSIRSTEIYLAKVEAETLTVPTYDRQERERV